MDIYIKGMEMLKEGDFIVIRPDGKAYYVSANPQHAYEGEAVPVPPHGDLIERDALLKKCEFVCTDDDEDVRAVRYSVIENAPTIIPASKEGE